MRYFEKRYQLETVGKVSRILAMAAAHHRLAFILSTRFPMVMAVLAD